MADFLIFKPKDETTKLIFIYEKICTKALYMYLFKIIILIPVKNNLYTVDSCHREANFKPCFNNLNNELT